MIMIKVFLVKGKYMMQYTCMYIYNNFSISYISQVIYLIYIIYDIYIICNIYKNEVRLWDADERKKQWNKWKRDKTNIKWQIKMII